MTGGTCGSALPNQSDLVLEVDPFSISATELNPLGYSYTICYSCDILPTGGLPIITFDRDLITISALALDCSNSLAVNAAFVNPTPPIPYNSIGSSLAVITSYTDIFTHS